MSAEAAHFLTLLDETAERFEIRTFDDDKTQSRRTLTREHTGSIEVLGGELSAMNTGGAGVFAVINEGGRIDDMIVRVRAVWCDTDGAPLEPIIACGLEPHIIVESSPGNWHVYWLVDNLPVAEFEPTQRAIAARFGTDPSVINPSRVMRLAGFKNRKPGRRSHVVKIIHESGAQRYSAERIHEVFGPIETAKPVTTHAPVAGAEHLLPEQIDELRDALTFIDAENREMWLKVLAALATADCGEPLAMEYSARSAKHRPAADLATFRDLVGKSRSNWRAIFDYARAGGWKDPPARGSSAPTTPVCEPEPVVSDELPAHAAAFLDLPYGLGDLQRHVKSRLIFADNALAAAITFAIVAHFAGRHVVVQGLKGTLSTCAYILVLAKTAGGKEAARQALVDLDKYMRGHPSARDGQFVMRLPDIKHDLPGSAQMLQKSLHDARGAVTFLPDELGDYLRSAATDKSKAATLAYLKQLSSRHMGEVNAPESLAGTARRVEAVTHPRVSVLGTATPKRVLDSMTASDAEGGLWNRWFPVVLDSFKGVKEYVWSGDEIAAPAPPQAVVDFLLHLLRLPEQLSARDGQTVVMLDDGAKREFERQDVERVIPLADADPMLAGRLAEHALKIAAYIALSDRRTTIAAKDIEIAFTVRIALYTRAKAIVGDHGALDGMHPTTRAVAKLTGLFRKRGWAYRGAMASACSAFAAMSRREQDDVIRALVSDKVVRIEGRKFASLIYEPET